ncbi:MAG: M28 family peptidase [Oscillospiraceae bacterium]|nr:M28 family peptidase [Oscillospiraceae bacterium]
MTHTSRELLERFQIRKSNKQKQLFRDWLCRQLEQAGYAPAVEKHRGIYTSHNVVAGDPDKAKVLVTAHYDTCAVLPFPNFITPRSLFWYLVYQLVIVAVFFAMVFVVTFGATLGAAWLLDDTDAASTVGMIAGYAVLIFDLWWMFDGKANRHTANDNTSGVITLLELALTLPEELRDGVCFVWFDNEERGLLGSSAFVRKHKAAKKNALVLNFDCVSDGDSIQFFPGKSVKKSAAMELLAESYLPAGDKRVEVVAGFGFYPSDQAQFRRGVGVCALKESKLFGYYMDRIHTNRDTVLDEDNIALLRSGTVRLIGAMKEKELYAK